jgi:hypothetical protein
MMPIIVLSAGVISEGEKGMGFKDTSKMEERKYGDMGNFIDLEVGR